MKRMSAMVLSTICIMNALASPVATAFADTNGYEYVNLDSDLDSETYDAFETMDEDVVSSSMISEGEDAEPAIDEDMELGDLEQYREYLNDSKTQFRDLAGNIVFINRDGELLSDLRLREANLKV